MPKTAPRHQAPLPRVPIRTPAKALKLMPDLAARIHTVFEITRRGDFDDIGRLSYLQVAGDEGQLHLIDFRKDGPHLGQARSVNQIVITDRWNGIPARLERSEQFCPACLAKCDVCKGKGKKTCEGAFCGGQGYRLEPTGRKPCPMCKGTKLMPCAACKGTGRRSTGLAGGEYRDDSRVPAQAKCSTCKGYQHVIREDAVDPTEFPSRTIGTMVVIGPLVRFTVVPSTPHTVPATYEVTEDLGGDPMMLVIESSQLPCAAYLIGGMARQVSR